MVETNPRQLLEDRPRSADGALRITEIIVTPVAFRDPPLLNATGIHQPWVLRAVAQVETASGLVGLGETYGDEAHVSALRAAGEALVGGDAGDLASLRRRVSRGAESQPGGSHGMAWMISADATDALFAPFEMGALDVQGKLMGCPVVDLLGGAHRDVVEFSGYLFSKLAGHPGGISDDWGEALDADSLVTQAHRMIDQYGFGSLKLKGGALNPEVEIEAILALAEAYPGMPLRLDPNAAWSEETAARVAARLEGSLEYLEDPVAGVAAMARIRQKTSLPLATNMCAVTFTEIEPAISAGAVDIILADPHSWGGLGAVPRLGTVATTFGFGLSMHSNSHLGISLAGMVHAAAATPGLTYACDTHWPWKDPADDVIEPGALEFSAGGLRVPRKPGLGVTLDTEALARMHQDWVHCGFRVRDDVAYARAVDPVRAGVLPRW